MSFFKRWRRSVEPAPTGPVAAPHEPNHSGRDMEPAPTEAPVIGSARPLIKPVSLFDANASTVTVASTAIDLSASFDVPANDHGAHAEARDVDLVTDATDHAHSTEVPIWPTSAPSAESQDLPPEPVHDLASKHLDHLFPPPSKPTLDSTYPSDASRTSGLREVRAPTIAPAVTAAFRLFERDDANGARAALERSALAGPLEAAGRELLDVLLPPNAPLEIIDAVLRNNDDDLSLLERSHWLARRFDSSLPEPLIQREAALDLLGSATMAGEAGWQLVQQPDRRARLDDALSEPGAQIDLLEQESLAPAGTGLPATVPGRTLAFGRTMAARGEFTAVRDAERLLHILREPQLAYLLENDRKRWGAGFRGALTAPHQMPYPGSRLTVVLAGGHPPLRRLARRDLDEMDLADVREFPSAWEGNRQGRHARDTVEGSDLAVVIWRQIAHSTSDQIMTAARSLSVPVVRADTPTISAIRRAVTDFQDPTMRRVSAARP